MIKPMSAADQRGMDWLMGWSDLGNGLTNCPETGNLLLSHNGDEQSRIKVYEINSDPLLRHAVGRAFLSYLKWDYANDPEGKDG